MGIEKIDVLITTGMIGGGGGAEGGGGALFSFLPLILIFLVFWLLLIRPQQKKQRQLREMISNLKPGDRVVTTGGIHGTVAAVTDEEILVKVADKVKIRFTRGAIAGLEGDQEGN